MNEGKQKSTRLETIFLLLITIITSVYSPIYADEIYEPSASDIASGFFADYKNVLIIMSVVIVLFLVGILIYFLLHRNTKQKNDPAAAHPVTLDPRTLRPQEGKPRFSSIGSIQGIGKRENQQDAIGISRVPRHFFRNDQLLIIADGMGGLQNGQAAAQMTVSGFLNAFYTGKFSPNQIPAALKNWAEMINKQVFQSFQGSAGTTLICVWLTHNSLYWISAGDSPLFLLRQNRLYRINESHNRVKDLYLSYMHEEITADDLMNSEQKENLTSNIGREKLPSIDCNEYPFEIKPGDRYLLCTDGISGFLEDADIIKAMQFSNAQQCCDELEHALNKKDDPKQDNYSAIAVFF